MIDPAAVAIKYRVVTFVLSAVLLIGGYSAFESMPRYEDPEFTIKEALVVTSYPGASAEEVENEITDLIETQIQQLSQLETVRSRSTKGISIVTVEIQEQYDKETLPQVWDELRRKVTATAGWLPPGAQTPLVIDDFGDVYGVYLVVTGDGYSYAEVKDYVDILKKELLLIDDVAKIETFGERQEAIYIEFDRNQLSQLGLSTDSLLQRLRSKNLVVDAGSVQVDSEFLTFYPSGVTNTVEDIQSLLITAGNGRQFFLKDIAQVKRDYLEPQSNLIRYDERAGIGLGVSTISGGNVVSMGEGLQRRLEELKADRPVGIEIGIVSFQSEAVTKAIDGFIESLILAILIVLAVLMVFMGLRSSLIIGFVLLLTISGSFIFLEPMGVALERISLGALIIALGMLVDNAIVIVDGMLTRMKRGLSSEEAASEVVGQTMWPLLGATIIAILAFAAIGTSDDSTGEFCRSLFQVVGVSLLLSWVTAITVTPLLGVMFLKSNGESYEDQSNESGILSLYRFVLLSCLGKPRFTVFVVVAAFGGSLWAFSFVDQNFFPSSTRQQFMVDLWMPQGTHIKTTDQEVKKLERDVLALKGTSHVTSMIGEGGLRFILTYEPEQRNSAYGQLLVDVSDPEMMSETLSEVENLLATKYGHLKATAYRFEVGPGGKGKIEARISGDDPHVLREIATQVEGIFRSDQDAKMIRTNWRQREKTLLPIIEDEQADLNGITRADIARTLRENFEGYQIGLYRESDLLIPIIVKGDAKQLGLGDLEAISIWSPVAGKMIPLRQVVSSYEIEFADQIIERRDRKRSLSVYTDPKHGYATALFARVRPKVDELLLPDGYEITWGGEYEDTLKAQTGLSLSIPGFLVAMFVITVMLFNSVKTPLLIWFCVPMALIGVASGLLLTGGSFGFMALLGFLSLSGMLIKNAIVLIDEIQLESNNGHGLQEALVNAGCSRLNPVAMAALTTALGLIPLLFDRFFVSMSITIIAGLIVATMLTMLLLPTLYKLAYDKS